MQSLSRRGKYVTLAAILGVAVIIAVLWSLVESRPLVNQGMKGAKDNLAKAITVRIRDLPGSLKRSVKAKPKATQP